jgi:hypothetical protein
MALLARLEVAGGGLCRALAAEEKNARRVRSFSRQPATKRKMTRCCA